MVTICRISTILDYRTIVVAELSYHFSKEIIFMNVDYIYRRPSWVAVAIHMSFINARNQNTVACTLKYKGCCIYSLCISHHTFDSEVEG